MHKYTLNKFRAFVLLDVLFALGLMAIFLTIIYQLKLQNIDRVESINNILTRERALRNFLVAEPYISKTSIPTALHEDWFIKSLNDTEVVFFNLDGNKYIYSLKGS